MGTESPSSRTVQRPGYEWAAAQIMDVITAAGMRAGDRLPTERELAAQLGVSRTVVREAIKVLTATGLVRTRQGSGMYVSAEPRPFATAAIQLAVPVDPEHILSLFEFRAVLEVYAVRVATERMTVRELRTIEDAAARSARGAAAGDQVLFSEGDATLHNGIAAATRNPFLAEAVATVRRLQGWAIEMALSAVPGSFAVAATEHVAIVRALKEGNPDAAAAAMQEHVQTVVASYQEAVRRRLASDRGGGTVPRGAHGGGGGHSGDDHV